MPTTTGAFGTAPPPDMGIWILIVFVFAALMFVLGYLFHAWMVSRATRRVWGADTPSNGGGDLQTIEGVGPKIALLLTTSGVGSLKEVASADVARLREILDSAGGIFTTHDPTTWPYQARLATEGRWEELREYQGLLHGGREY